jgi:hypothetical protein
MMQASTAVMVRLRQATVRLRTVGLPLGLLAAAACNTNLPAAVDAGGLAVGIDDRCGALKSAPSMAPMQVAPTDDCDDADAGTEFSPATPLGLAYDDIGPELPAKTAYLTFDDGPSEWTNEFLDVLKDRGVHATFFVTAKQLKGEVGLQGSRSSSGYSSARWTRAMSSAITPSIIRISRCSAMIKFRLRSIRMSCSSTRP